MPEAAQDSGRQLQVLTLGLVPYARGLEIQQEAVEARRSGDVPDRLLLLEHPHVITLGASSNPEHVLADEKERQALGIELFDAGRGGDVTYHGPGQLVGYPILDLKPDRKDLHRYLRDLEEVLMRALAALGLEGKRAQGLTGVWVGGRKIAAIGVRMSSGWITSHGFALNVENDLRYFDFVVPCGIHGREVTSVSRELGRTVTVDEAAQAVMQAFGKAFEREIHVLQTTKRFPATGSDP